MRERRFAPLLCVLLFLAEAAGAQAQAPPQAPARALDGFDAYVEQAMRDWEVPGVAIAVVKDDAVVYSRGFGVRQVGTTLSVDPNTVFAIASLTKSFTSTAVGMLVDEGKVNWDDPVTRHLPEFQLADPWVTRNFTVRDLLSHRSGLERGDWLWFGTPYERDDVVHHLRFLRTTGAFRSDYGYSNNMYITAGRLIANVSGMSWDDFVTERIFRPLGMRRSNTSVLELPELDNIAIPHEKLDGSVRTVPHGNLDNEGPGGSINSSANQMAQWMRFLLGGGAVDGERLIDSSTLAEATTPQTVIRFNEQEAAQYPGVNFMAYGFGWRLQDYRGRKLVQHGGAFDGMRAQIALVPEEGLGIVILTNLGRGHDLQGALRNRVLDAFLGAEERDWSAEYRARLSAAEEGSEAAEREWDASRVSGTRTSLPLERYAGSYEDAAFGTATVRQDADGLVVTLGPRHTGRLEHWHYDTFVATWENPFLGRTAITFPLDAEGNVAAMDVRGVRAYLPVDGTDP